MRDYKRAAVAPKTSKDVHSGCLPGPLRSQSFGCLYAATVCRATAQPLAKRTRAFTLAELLVTTGVLVLLVLLASQLLTSTATVTTLGHKQMEADAQARQVLDRMAIDFAQMVKRSDLDFFGKRTNTPNSRGGAMVGNDQIAFYSAVPGYYPATGSQSPVSLVAYRLNSDSTSSAYNKMERMGKGLVWNGVSSTDTPVVFMPIKITDVSAWSAATNSSAVDAAYELVGSQVFRFEYYYLLKNGNFSDTPWISPHDSVSGMQDVSAIVVDIAVIDPKSKVLLDNSAQVPPPNDNITVLRGQLVDYATGMVPGQLRASWQNTLNANTTLPRPAVSGIRLYERFMYLSPPVL